MSPLQSGTRPHVGVAAAAARSRNPSRLIKGGVQWKQGVVIYMMSHTSLLYDTIPIHCTLLPLHPPLPSIQFPRLSAYSMAPAVAAGETRAFARRMPATSSSQGGSMCVYIYIYIERERVIDIYITHIYIYTERERGAAST